MGLRRTSEARELVAAAVETIADPVEADFVRAKWATVLTLAGQFVEAGAVARPLLDASDVRVRIRAIVPAGHGLTLTGKCETVLGLTDELLRPALTLASDLPSGPFWVASVRVLALLTAGRLQELAQFLDLIDEAGTGGRFTESQALLHITRGRLAILQGRPISATDHLRAAVALTEDGSRSELQSWALCLLAEALALAGDVPGAEHAWQEGAPAAGSDVRPLHHADATRARAWLLAARGERGPARAWLEAVADQCQKDGLAVHELVARHDAVRLGSNGGTVERIVALASEMEGALAPAFAGHVRALSSQDGDGLDAAADRFEELGALLLAAEAAAQAGAAFGRAGLRARASQAEARSAALGARCEGAKTPVLLERPELAHLTSREHEVATLAASGLASREIAGRLLLSQRTVDNYLQRAYRKLGIRRREELAAALDGEAPPG